MTNIQGVVFHTETFENLTTVQVCALAVHVSYTLEVRRFAGNAVTAKLQGVGLPTECSGRCKLRHDIRKALDSDTNFIEPLDAGWRWFVRQVQEHGFVPTPYYRYYTFTRYEDGDSGAAELCFGGYHVSDSISEMGMPGSLGNIRHCDRSCRKTQIILPPEVASVVRRHRRSAPAQETTRAV